MLAATRARIGRIACIAMIASATAVLAVGAAVASGAAGLVGQWRFDEGAGQVAHDDGPLGLHGVLGSSAAADAADPLWIAGAAGSALRMSGSSYVTVADDRKLDLPTLTVEAVARAQASPGAYRYLIAHGTRGCLAGSYGLYTASNGGLAFYVFDGERFFVSPSADPAQVWDGAWHRLSGTFDGSTVRAFVDGREVGRALATPPGTAIEYESMPTGTHFGVYIGACQLAFTGDLDSVRIWSRAAAPSASGSSSAAAGPQLDMPRHAAAVSARTIVAKPPKSSCAVRASRKRIAPRRRAVVGLRATGARGRPLRRVRLSVRHAGNRKLIAVRRTNARGRARLVLKVRKNGRLRVGVIGRSRCTPAFIRVSPRDRRAR